MFVTNLIFGNNPKSHSKLPGALGQENQCDANFQVGLQKYIILLNFMTMLPNLLLQEGCYKFRFYLRLLWPEEFTDFCIFLSIQSPGKEQWKIFLSIQNFKNSLILSVIFILYGMCVFHIMANRLCL